MQGADVNSTTDYDGRTALHIACVEGNTEAVKFLLKHGASTQVRDRFNTYPLDDAIKFRHKEIVKTLRKAGAQLMKSSMETAVELCRLAAKNRVDDLLVWQLAGVDLNSCDYDKRTPLHVVSFGLVMLTSLLASVISESSLCASLISLLSTRARLESTLLSLLFRLFAETTQRQLLSCWNMK